MSMYKNQSQLPSSLTSSSPAAEDPETRRAHQLWMGHSLARFTVKRREDIGMTLDEAAALSGLELSQWVALEIGWVPEEANLRRAIAATLQVDYTWYSLVATISSFSQQSSHSYL